MLALTLLLLLQAPTTLRTGTASDYAVPQTFRLSGKIVVGLDEPVITLVTLKPVVGDTPAAQTVQSFANGTFRFENVQLATYVVEVVDSHFNLYQNTIWLREPKDTSKELFIRLTRFGEGGAQPAPDIELYTLNAETLASMPPKAIEEFNKGVDAIRNPAKNNPADAHFKRAIAAAPQFYEAQLQLGLEQQRQNKKDDAIQSFERAAAIKPAESRPLSALGSLYVDTQKYQKAADTLAKLAALAKLSPRNEYDLGTAFYRLERMPEAVEHLLASINSGNDTDPAPFLQLHNVFIKMRNGGAALEVLDDYLKLFPYDSNHAVMTERAQQMRKLIKPPLE
jgi:hypothetical protein